MNLDTIVSAIPIAVAFALGGVLGMTFADIDLAPPLPIRHRSAWTHGAWVALLLFLLRGVGAREGVLPIAAAVVGARGEAEGEGEGDEQ